MDHSRLNYSFAFAYAGDGEINDTVNRSWGLFLLLIRLQCKTAFTVKHEKLLHCRFGCKPPG